ncbi:hypothetical protein LEP1GSC059_0946 [Leptospira noguchii serovar Panama str. CZ214]|uniref:Uncharacterized protein n=1 Tax=Leptospira noguchii serovar Panama str. CZ214 TaxID=1001595 RepID=T0FES3_9LEPT|nr:hypothetical protein LEP1GSC059_0946 [Leptospira noguchii serovar Panama str. CZ214]
MEMSHDKKDDRLRNIFFYCLAFGFYFSVIFLLSLQIIVNVRKRKQKI